MTALLLNPTLLSLLILGAVAALSALAALPYRTRTLRRRFARP